ncbi:MAG: hypothetical protein U0790_00035 [Isosphaeraceae bacterium]
MDRSDAGEMEPLSGRPKGRSRGGSPARANIVAAAPRRAAARNVRLQAMVPEPLLHQVKLLALQERTPLNVLVAEMLQAGINRRPTFVRFLKLTEEVARSMSADAAPTDDAAA